MSPRTRPAPPFVERPPTPSLRMHAWVKRFNRPVVAVLAVGLIAGYLRFLARASPEQRARCLVSRETDGARGAGGPPPPGKWMIAFGELAFGTESMGWRTGAAVT